MILGTVLALTLFSSTQDSGLPEVGQVFPDLKFPQLDEPGLASLADWRGTKVLLIQFASW